MHWYESKFNFVIQSKLNIVESMHLCINIKGYI